jgi:hypothetical protein
MIDSSNMAIYYIRSFCHIVWITIQDVILVLLHLSQHSSLHPYKIGFSVEKRTKVKKFPFVAPLYTHQSEHGWAA